MTPSDAPEPPPPLGSWCRFYWLVALVHIAVVTVLFLVTRLFQLPMGHP